MQRANARWNHIRLCPSNMIDSCYHKYSTSWCKLHFNLKVRLHPVSYEPYMMSLNAKRLWQLNCWHKETEKCIRLHYIDFFLLSHSLSWLSSMSSPLEVVLTSISAWEAKANSWTETCLASLGGNRRKPPER